MAEGIRFPVDATAILCFAAALGETNRIYYDEAYARATGLGGVIAPPTFPTAAAHWNPLGGFRGVSRIPAASPQQLEQAAARAAQRSGGEGGADLMRVLHGEQRFEYHRPVRPGQTLHATTRPGKTWEKQGRRGGNMQFSERVSEYRDEQGELVVTATSVSIVTSRAAE